MRIIGLVSPILHCDKTLEPLKKTMKLKKVRLHEIWKTEVSTILDSEASRELNAQSWFRMYKKDEIGIRPFEILLKYISKQRNKLQ